MDMYDVVGEMATASTAPHGLQGLDLELYLAHTALNPFIEARSNVFAQLCQVQIFFVRRHRSDRSP